MKKKTNGDLELTLLMPCLNEAETLEVCIKKAMKSLKDNKIKGEVLIADNGSDDGSQAIAKKNGARVVNVPTKGYGAALIGGCNAAKGKYVIMGDADDSYAFDNIMPFVKKLREGYELVMGNRFKGGIEEGAMPPLHKYIGNPVLSWLGRVFYGSKIGDFHCGLRGYNTEKMRELDLQTTGMEYASEMVVKSELNGLKIAEVPTTLKKDGRSHPPHLRSWSDGWRHLKFLLMYSPKWLFMIPGTILTAIGLLGTIVLSFTPVSIGNVTFDVQTLFYFVAMLIVGIQILFFALYAKIYGMNNKMLPAKTNFDKKLLTFKFETILKLGVVMFIVGIILLIVNLVSWGSQSFGTMDVCAITRMTALSIIALALGVQLIFGSFFMGILQINHKS